MAQAKIIAIAAIGRNRGLGKDNNLIYKIPEDMKHFRDATMGHPIVTGRKNFESMGRALPGRPTIVVTRDTTYMSEGVIVVHAIEDALAKARELDTEKIFIIGGGEIYKAALPYTDQLDLTLIDDEKEADVFFPEYSEFTKVISEEKKEHEGTSYSFVTLTR
ncbi:dihydrofolate reductase [Patescibacteria group bacterium]|nr:MAG: dihydrofolate reductase [Patescibacteria group bacterium]